MARKEVLGSRRPQFVRSHSSSEYSAIRILLVDNEQEHRFLCERQLREEGYVVLSAGGGHNWATSGNYVLPGGGGQNVWRWCYKCQGLFFAGHSNGTCPAGGGHDPSKSSNCSLPQWILTLSLLLTASTSGFAKLDEVSWLLSGPGNPPPSVEGTIVGLKSTDAITLTSPPYGEWQVQIDVTFDYDYYSSEVPNTGKGSHLRRQDTLQWESGEKGKTMAYALNFHQPSAGSSNEEPILRSIKN
jgi:hypothetical protein